VDRRGLVVAEDDVAQAVADQDVIDAGLFGEAAERGVVGGDHREDGVALAAADRAGRHAPHRRPAAGSYGRASPAAEFACLVP